MGIVGYFALKHELTPGDVVMFVSYVGMLYDPIDALTSLAIELQQYGIALRRVGIREAAHGGSDSFGKTR